MNRFMIFLGGALYLIGCAQSQPPPRQTKYSPMAAQNSSSYQEAHQKNAQESSLPKEEFSPSSFPS